ncbi:MAG: YndM family protein [Desulfosporosinus sp.]|nr:YndM family protein [Desulfosporosinus sp.]
MGLLFGISLGNIFTLSLYLGIVAYLLGDLVVLPMRGNLIATVADFGLALIGIWLLSYYIARP